ncbi:MAG: hypothetical protein ACI8W3_001418 [Myxococcota bacterium]|jgi:hypothetical protein
MFGLAPRHVGPSVRNKGDTQDPSLPSDPEELRALARIGYLRQASAWASVIWFPTILVLFSIDQQAVAAAVVIAGTSFSGVLRGIVALSRCPRCDNRYAQVPGGYREIWQSDRCASCGLARYAN